MTGEFVRLKSAKQMIIKANLSVGRIPATPHFRIAGTGTLELKLGERASISYTILPSNYWEVRTAETKRAFSFEPLSISYEL